MSRADSPSIADIQARCYTPHEQPYFEFLVRVVAAPMTKLLLATGLRANTVTLVMNVLGFGAGVAFGLGHPLLAIGLTHAYFFVDAADGWLAKVTTGYSRTGLFLDHASHYLTHAAFFAGLAVWLGGVHGRTVLVLGIAAALGNVIARALIDTYRSVVTESLLAEGRPASARDSLAAAKAMGLRAFIVSKLDFPFVLSIFTVGAVTDAVLGRGPRVLTALLVAYGVATPLYVAYLLLRVWRADELDRAPRNY